MKKGVSSISSSSCNVYHYVSYLNRTQLFEHVLMSTARTNTQFQWLFRFDDISASIRLHCAFILTTCCLANIHLYTHIYTHTHQITKHFDNLKLASASHSNCINKLILATFRTHFTF